MASEARDIDSGSMPRLTSVQVGQIAPLGPDRVPSGYVKGPVSHAVPVHFLGLDGDAQADLRVHGGPDKAVYAYAATQYGNWIHDFPEHRARLFPGAFGENLTIDGLEEVDLCVGDVHAIGSVHLQICQPRQPCFKFSLHFGDNRMPRAMVRTGRAGWYYRVVREGVLCAGDDVQLIARPNPDLPFTRLVEIVNNGAASAEEFALLASADGLADWLKAAARDRLQ